MAKKMGYIFPKRIKEIMQGGTPKVTVGMYGKTTKEERKVGEIWTDSDGKTWEQKDGYVTRVTRHNPEDRLCKKCKKLILKRTEDRIFMRTGMCIDCTAQYETELRFEGKWDDIQAEKNVNNFKSYLLDVKQQMEDYLKNLTDEIKIVNHDGTFDTLTADSTPQRKFFEDELKKIDIQLDILDSENSDERAFYYNCKDNFLFFYKNAIKIKSNDSDELISPTIYPYLKELYDTLENNNSIVIKKSRQIGMTTVMSAYILWKSIFNENYVSMTNSCSQAIVSTIMKNIKKMYENLPKFLSVNILENNLDTIKFDNQSQIFATNANDILRMSLYNIDTVYFDEGGHIPDEYYLLILPCLKENSKFIIATTGAINEKFYKYWEDDKFTKLKFDWTVRTERTQEWRETQTSELGKEFAIKEYDAIF